MTKVKYQIVPQLEIYVKGLDLGIFSVELESV